MRIAYVVFNDTYRDSRVLKMLDAAADAGHDARLVAIGGPLSHFGPGIELRGSGADIERVELIPDAWRVARKAKLALAADRARARVPSTLPTAEESDGAGPGGTVSAAVPRRPAWQRKIAGMVLRPVARISTVAINAIRRASFDRRTSAAIVRWRPELIHAHDANTLRAAMRASRRTGAPFVYDAHELWEQRNAKLSAFGRWRERRLLDRATRRMAGSVTVSPGIQDWMRERYRLTEAPTLVRNIPQSTQTAGSRSEGELRARAGLGVDDHVLVYVGRITSGRGIEETIGALRELPDVHFVLLGYGPDAYVDRIRARIDQEDLGSRVHLIGSVDSADVSRVIADADASIVYTQPLNLSYFYSLPNKLFESIHAGQAVIASDLPDVAALVSQYGCGKTFAVGDTGDLALAIRQVIADPEAYRAGARRAATELTWENEMARLFELYTAAMR